MATYSQTVIFGQSIFSSRCFQTDSSTSLRSRRQKIDFDATLAIPEQDAENEPGGKLMKYRVLIEQDEDGVFVVEVPSLPGCISQGRTRAEATANIKEAIALYLESLAAHNDPVPPPITEELIEVGA
jgi:predicted RNase H-like HicB family nuclease